MKIDRSKFLVLYQKTFGSLNPAQKEGLNILLSFIEQDKFLSDVRWASYMLATTKHECGDTWKPIKEYGRGKGRKYGVPDSRTGQTYYGRGYTQNTWYDNYLKLTNVWNKVNPDTPVNFTTHPDLLCEPEYAYWAMSYAMRNGMYTGVSLNKYFNDTRDDSINARRVINGTDCAREIAGYDKKFRAILKEVII